MSLFPSSQHSTSPSLTVIILQLFLFVFFLCVYITMPPMSPFPGMLILKQTWPDTKFTSTLFLQQIMVCQFSLDCHQILRLLKKQQQTWLLVLPMGSLLPPLIRQETKVPLQLKHQLLLPPGPHRPPPPPASGLTSLTAAHSQKCLEIPGSAQCNGTAATQSCGTAAANQQFQLTSVGTDTFQLIATHSGKCLEIAGGSTADGARVQQNACSTGTRQQFRVQVLRPCGRA